MDHAFPTCALCSKPFLIGLGPIHTCCRGCDPEHYRNRAPMVLPHEVARIEREREIATLKRWAEMCESDRGDEVAREMRCILASAATS